MPYTRLTFSRLLVLLAMLIIPKSQKMALLGLDLADKILEIRIKQMQERMK